MTVLCILALVAGSALGLGWLGYPLVLRALATASRRSGAGADPAPPAWSGVSVVIATREPPEVIRKRLQNLREIAAGQGPVECIVAVDARASSPPAAYHEACGSGFARFVPGDAPGGKACTLNAAVREATQPVVVFTDSVQRFAPEAIPALLRRFADPTVGAATGTLQFGSAASTSPLLELFWAYELGLRRLESRLDSVVAVTGAIYALRRELWVPLPAGLICDDLFIPMQVVRRGKRVVAEETSIALDDRRFTPAQEFGRKVRTLTGMIQFCALCPWALVPFRNRVWGQFVCHKLLRLLTPYLVVVTAAGAAAGLGGGAPGWLWPALAVVLAGSLAALFLAPEASRLRSVRRHVVTVGYLLAAPVVATLHALRGNWDIWTPPRGRSAA